MIAKQTSIKRSIISTGILMLTVSFLFSGCWIPEEFEAEFTVNNDGTFSFLYEGTLVQYMIAAAVAQGSLGKREEKDLEKDGKKELENQGYTKVDYEGEGRYEVVYKKSGTVDRPFYFPGFENKLFTLQKTKDNIVELKGIKLKEDELKQMADLHIKIDGDLEVKTNGQILEHNATSEPFFFGLLGGYKWRIKSAKDPAPFIRIQLAAKP